MQYELSIIVKVKSKCNAGPTHVKGGSQSGTPLLAGLTNTGSYVPPLSLEPEPVPDLNIPFLKL